MEAATEAEDTEATAAMGTEDRTNTRTKTRRRTKIMPITTGLGLEPSATIVITNQPLISTKMLPKPIRAQQTRVGRRRRSQK